MSTGVMFHESNVIRVPEPAQDHMTNHILAADTTEIECRAEAWRAHWQTDRENSKHSGNVPFRPHPMDLRGCETGRIKQESLMQYTGDRCCIAAGTNIIFEGTEAECRAHAKKVLDPQHLGYEQLSIYAPLAVVSRKSEVVLDFREISKVKK